MCNGMINIFSVYMIGNRTGDGGGMVPVMIGFFSSFFGRLC